MADDFHTPDSDPSRHLSQTEAVSIYERLAKMDVAERIKAALLGSREERQILIRDSNRLVWTAVLQSPKLILPEVEKIANMKNIDDDILRMIAEKREWVSNYAIIVALVRNPKTPIPSSLKLVPRLQPRDVRFLAKDKTVAEPVRKMAAKIVRDKRL
ncbi:MAG TPA: hypothetical protein VGQ81_15035 [Acidobacteriota bacterium]|jgi:hypothetical protein|nr:hypothetical protein [Acidobacteriota bacterium]